MAVAVSGDRTTYIQALARLEEHRSPIPALVLSATGGSLLGRVRRLAGKPNGEFGSAAAGVWFSALAPLLVVVVLATGHVRAVGEADSSSQGESIAATDDDEGKGFCVGLQRALRRGSIAGRQVALCGGERRACVGRRQRYEA